VPPTEELEQRKAALRLAQTEIERRFQEKFARGEAKVLRGIMQPGESTAMAVARLRAEAGDTDPLTHFILREIVPMSDEFLQQQARYQAEADKITADRIAAADEWRPAPRAMIPDELTPVQVTVEIDGELPNPIVGHYIVANGDVILTSPSGKPLGNGRYARPLHPDARPDRIARSLLIKFDLERGKGERELNYPQRPVA
jgi:hypothetical protein